MFPKEFIIEDNTVYYRKKPLHQQPLFWTTVVGAVLTFILAITTIVFFLAYLGSDQGMDTSLPYDSYYDSYEGYGSYDSYTEYEVGDTVTFDPDIDVTVLSMDRDSSIELIDSYYSTAFVVELEITNHSTEDYYFDEYAFSLMDPVYESYFYLDYRTYDVNIPEKIEPGETIEVELIYGIDSETNLSLLFEDVAWNRALGGSL